MLGVMHSYGSPHQARIAQRARDRDVARGLWELSEKYTAVTFSPQ